MCVSGCYHSKRSNPFQASNLLVKCLHIIPIWRFIHGSFSHMMFPCTIESETSPNHYALFEVMNDDSDGSLYKYKVYMQVQEKSIPASILK